MAYTTTIDPFTGQSVTTQAGYHVENMSIVVTIKNPSPTYSYSYANYNPPYRLFYSVQAKGHFEQDWISLNPSLKNQSNSNYTVISYSVGENGEFLGTHLPPNAQVDFQVESVVGHDSQVFVSDYPFGPSYMRGSGHYVPTIAVDISSGWRNTQTITVAPANTPSPTPTPSAKDSLISQFTIPIIAAAIFVVLVISLLLYSRHRKRVRFGD